MLLKPRLSVTVISYYYAKKENPVEPISCRFSLYNTLETIIKILFFNVFKRDKKRNLNGKGEGLKWVDWFLYQGNTGT